MFIVNSLMDAQATLIEFLGNSNNIKLIETSISKLVKAFNNNNNCFSCGNGGSMCDAEHFAEELTGRYKKDRKSLPAQSIISPGHISCVANDYGYEYVFSRYIEGWGRSGDILLAISTSGNSQNIINAVKVAKEKKMFVIALLGKSGGSLKDLVDIPIVVNSNSTDRIQEVHIKIIHILIEGIERSLFPENYNN